VLEAKRERASAGTDAAARLATPGGCPFSPRCPRAQFPLCAEVPPPLEMKQDGHLAACHFAGAA
jgi:ABC-type dipeptide/oligopeptide/nickel transport system ATPase component